MSGDTEAEVPRTRKATLPIFMMVVLILVTISISLFIGPFYNALGLTAGMGEYTDNPLNAFIFLGMVIITAVVILLLRKLLKRRRLKLKYLLALAVLLSTTTVLAPLIDMGINGVPDIWDEYHFDAEGAYWVLPLDPLDAGKGILVVTGTSFHTMLRGRNEYREVDSVEGVFKVFDPFYRDGRWLVSCDTEEGPNTWVVDTSGNIDWVGMLGFLSGGSDFVGAQFYISDGKDLMVSFWSNQTSGAVFVSPFDNLSASMEIDLDLDGRQGPIRPLNGWYSGPGNSFFSRNFTARYGPVESASPGKGGYLANVTYHPARNILWGVSMGEMALLFREGSASTENQSFSPGLLVIDPSTGAILGQTREDRPVKTEKVWLSTGPRGAWKAFVLQDGTVRAITLDGADEFDLTEAPISVFAQGPEGPIWIATGQSVSTGELRTGEHLQIWVQGLAFLLSLVLVAVIMKRPKWWLIDLAGILMGAGVIALMGISFPLLFTLLLLVLLAAYDAVAVYKTKHMIALADSVVEAKMPILLVFPMKLDYRYEDETNLMDPKRERRSLFMGLGDVIIPGILIVSAYSFLPLHGGTYLFGFVPPNLGVALFTLLGMLMGFAVLIGFVLKGKAHAGLPPLNGGSILMFLVGHLIIYGTLVFW